MRGFFSFKRFNMLRLGSIGLDLAVAATSFYASYFIAYGFEPLRTIPGVGENIVAFTMICAITFMALGVNKGSWRYVSIVEITTIIKATVVAVCIYTFLAFLTSRGQNVPRSVPILSALFIISGICGSRLIYRLAVNEDWKGVVLWKRAAADKYVLLVGVTNIADNFIRSIRRNSGPDIRIVAIFDEDRSNRSKLIHGIKVVGALSDVDDYVERCQRSGIKISELIITEENPDRQRLSDILEVATSAALKVSRIRPATATSSVTSAALLEPKPIELRELLGRKEVSTDIENVAHLIHGTSILVTGAGGSIGSELCNQIASFNPGTIIVTDSCEYNLYTLDKHLRSVYPHLSIFSCIADVRNGYRLENLFEEFQPEIIFHAAALKHVSLGESNPLEAIKTNILGTRNVANAALAYNATAFVMISTDKAVNPTNIMGATKRAAEAYCQSLDVSSSKTRFMTVRFGNVLGSSGSVVPKFQQQIMAGGPVTVTHPQVTRYFMTIPEASQLVLNASARALRHQQERGTIMVLDMGEPVRIVHLAERMIQLAGYRPHIDVQISYTGLRPGEKLFEELFEPSELDSRNVVDGYMLAAPRIIDKGLLGRTMESIEVEASQENTNRALELLHHLVPEFTRQKIENSPDRKPALNEPPHLPDKWPK